MSTSRTEAFSDGIFAIAATLLVLNLHVPEANGGLLTAVVQEWPAYATYAVSFLTIGIIWVNHHAIFDHLQGVDRSLQFLNLILLLFVALIPFPTALLSRYLQAAHDQAAAGMVYGSAMTLMALSFGALWAYVLNSGLLVTSGHSPRQRLLLLIRFGIGTPFYAAGIAAALIDAKISLLIYAALALYYLFEQVPNRHWHEKAATSHVRDVTRGAARRP